jgi:hypothetical protein
MWSSGNAHVTAGYAKVHNHVEIPSKYNKKFWEELGTYFPLIQHGPHRKECLLTTLRYCGNVFTTSLPGNDRGIHGQTHRLSFNMTWMA